MCSSRSSRVTTNDGEPSPLSGPTYVSTERSTQPAGRSSDLNAGCGLVVDKLDVHHRSRVARPGADLDDPRITAGTLGEARSDLVEQPVHGVLAAQERHRISLRGDVGGILAGERDQLLRDRPQLLGLGLGGADTAVLEQRARHVREQGLTVRRVPAELPSATAMPHSDPRMERPWAASVSLTSSIDFLPKLGIAASSASVLATRSPIVSMPTRLRQL